MTGTPPNHVARNRAAWTAANAAYTDAEARRKWAQDQIAWGVWGVPDAQLRALPEVRGRDIIELGCGTAYFGAWLKRAGARRVVGVDVTPAQLETARRCDAEFRLGLELIEADAERVPLQDAQFDIAFSEYGASIWCDPERWIPEAARLLRAEGELIFLRNSTIATLCTPDTGRVDARLHRAQHSVRRIEWPDDESVEFHPPAGDMLRLLRTNGFEVLDLIEVYAPDGARDHPHYDTVPVEWARDWPAEEIWRARKRAPGPDVTQPKGAPT